MIDQNKKEHLARRLEQSMMTPSISRHFPKKTSQSCGGQLKAKRLARCLVRQMQWPTNAPRFAGGF